MVVAGAGGVVVVIGTVVAAEVVGMTVVDGASCVPAVVVAGVVAGVAVVVAGATVVTSGSEAEAPHPATTKPSETMSTASLETRPGPVPMLVTEPSYPAEWSTRPRRGRVAGFRRRVELGCRPDIEDGGRRVVSTGAMTADCKPG